VLGGATVEQTWCQLVVSSFRFALGIAVGRHARNASHLTAKFESVVAYKLMFFLSLLHLSSSRPFPSPFPSCIVRTAKRQLSRSVIDKLYTELIAIIQHSKETTVNRKIVQHTRAWQSKCGATDTLVVPVEQSIRCVCVCACVRAT